MVGVSGTNPLETALNPDPSNLPPLDPKDALLLADPSTSSAAFPVNGNSHSASNFSQPTLANVSWLRKTEYITRESSQRQTGQEPFVLYLFFFRKHRQFFLSFCRKHVVSTSIDVSKSAQLRDIESSFVAQNDGFVLDQLQHPNKLNVTAVESYPILPDIDIWANQYDLFRFSERPGERPVDVSNVLRFLSEVQTAFFGNKDRRSTTGLCHSKAHENGPRFFPRILSHSG